MSSTSRGLGIALDRSRRSAVGRSLLVLIEDDREGFLHGQRLLDLAGRDERILAVLQEARPLMVTHELDERGRIGSPILREPLELLEDRGDSGGGEKLDGVLDILVEIRVEDALIHEVHVLPDREEYPAQIVQLQWGEHVRIGLHRLLERRPVLPNLLLGTRFDLRDDREAVTRRRALKGWTISSAHEGDKTLARDRHRARLGPFRAATVRVLC